MQTKYILPSLALLFIVNVTPTLAKDSSSSVWQQVIREDRRDFKEARVLINVTPNPTRTEQRRARVQAVYDQMVKSLNLRLNSYQSFKTKLQTRITQRSTTRDITLAQAKLNEFDPLVTTYNTHLASLSTKLTEVLASDKPLTKLGELKRTANSARDDLKAMRRVLTDTIRLLVKAPAKP